MKKEYSIGLDIGTNSVGYAVMTNDFKVPSKKMKVFGNTDKNYIKKNLIGVELFEEGLTAEERRLKRNARRRYTRRRQRLLYLQSIFEEEINKVDKNFLLRLEESFFTSDDKTYEKFPVFGSKKEEQEFHKNYPTIYHLRKELVDNAAKADIRLIYLAISHIIKFRGHFLIEGDLDVENTSVKELFKSFIKEYNEVFNKDNGNDFIDENIDISHILVDKISKSKKVEDSIKLFINEKTNGILAQFLKLIVGNVGNFKDLGEEDLKLQISKDTFEQDLEEVLGKIGDEYAELFLKASKVYNAIILSGILSDDNKETRAKFSSSMIKRFMDHKRDLKLLKEFILKNSYDLYKEIFKDKTKPYYAGYIDGHINEEEFYKKIKEKLKSLENSDYFIEKINQEQFLRKIRTFDNGVIPNQIHKNELILILKNQGKYYKFLNENFNKIIKILEFRIPYYVGPLAKNSQQSTFSWIKRLNNNNITPWNFDDVVDKNASAVEFIERMTSYDTYLPKEKVLPKQSIIYQKYMIFNELTKVVYINDGGLNLFDSKLKKDIFENLFKKYRKVTKKHLTDFLQKVYNLDEIQIKGIDKAFNASFNTYHDLCKVEGMKEILDDDININKIEEIIKILTLFEDREMKKDQLSKYNEILNKKMIKELSRKKYNGWGNLSIKLIDGIRSNKDNKTILDYLIDDDGVKKPYNRNFMQLINDDSLGFKKRIEDENKVDIEEELEEIVRSLAGSPAIKKGILQSLKIVEELIAVMGYLPKNIIIEMARENQSTEKGKNKSKERLKKLEDGIKKLISESKEVSVLNKIENNDLRNDRLYLYYLQNGKDMYTGKALDINRLFDYDIDHIIPQSFIDDDSIDNKVLVSSAANRGKLDNVPSIETVVKMKGYWELLRKSGLLSDRKFNNLTKSERGGLNESDKEGFINRQLVETRQITKNVASILNQKYNADDENINVITLKSAMTSKFRKMFELYKVREINTYHHAHDAYLNAVVANMILLMYPQCKNHFVYGQYDKIKFDGNNKATQRLKFNSNLINGIKNIEHIIDNETGEIIFSKKEIIENVKKVLSFNSINVVKKVEEQKGKFCKETVVPKGESDKLIPRKNNLDPKKYGGYIEPVIAYSLAVYYKDRNKIKTTMLGVSIMEKESFEKDNISFIERKGYSNIIKFIKLPKYSLFELKDGTRRLLASNKELQKGNSLMLPKDYIDLIYHSSLCEDIMNVKSLEYITKNKDKYEELLDYILNFADKYIHANENSKNIRKIFYDNKDADIKEYAKSFINLLTFTYMGAPAAFKFFDKNIERKRYTSVSEVWEGVLIYQSVTGLYETRIDMRKIKWDGEQ